MAGRARSKKARVGSKTARFDSETFPDMPQSKRPKNSQRSTRKESERSDTDTEETTDTEEEEERQAGNGGLEVAAFNIQVFGKTKSGKEEVMRVLSKIICRYDIILIQEIRDTSGNAIIKLLEEVNMEALREGVEYTHVISEREGRSKSKEQYCYIYRTDTVEILEIFQYEDYDEDGFERPPFCAHIGSLKLDIPNFIMIGVHIKPSHVESELRHLKDVYKKAKSFFCNESAILLGDMNADCRYLTAMKLVKVLSNTPFRLFSGARVDTTTTSSKCVYDRFLGAGPIKANINRDTVGVFRYDLKYSLSKDFKEAISDHFPIELLLQETTVLQEISTSSMGSE